MQDRSLGNKFPWFMFAWGSLYFSFILKAFLLDTEFWVGGVFSFGLFISLCSPCLHGFWREVQCNSHPCSSIGNCLVLLSYSAFLNSFSFCILVLEVSIDISSSSLILSSVVFSLLLLMSPSKVILHFYYNVVGL